VFQRQAVGDIGADHENSRSAIRVQWNRIQPRNRVVPSFPTSRCRGLCRRDLSVSRDPRAYVRREPFDSTTIQRLAGDGCFLPFQNRRCRFIPLSNIAPRVQFNQQRRDRIEKNLRVPMSLAQNFISPPATVADISARVRKNRAVSTPTSSRLSRIACVVTSLSIKASSDRKSFAKSPCNASNSC